MRIIEGVIIVGFIFLIGITIHMAAIYVREPPTCWEQALTIANANKYEGIVCGYRVYPIKEGGFNVRPVKGMTWK